MYKIQFKTLAGITVTVNQKAPDTLSALLAVHRAYGHLVTSRDYAVSR